MEWARIDKDKETKLIVGYVARYEEGVDKPNVVNLVFNDVELCKYIKVIVPPFSSLVKAVARIMKELQTQLDQVEISLNKTWVEECQAE